MGDVVDLGKHREERGWKALFEAIMYPPIWPMPVATTASQRIELEGYAPYTEIIDETHLWAEPTPERRAEAERVLRILRDHADTAGDPGDEAPARD